MKKRLDDLQGGFSFGGEHSGTTVTFHLHYHTSRGLVCLWPNFHGFYGTHRAAVFIKLKKKRQLLAVALGQDKVIKTMDPVSSNESNTIMIAIWPPPMWRDGRCECGVAGTTKNKSALLLVQMWLEELLSQSETNRRDLKRTGLTSGWHLTWWPTLGGVFYIFYAKVFHCGEYLGEHR